MPDFNKSDRQRDPPKPIDKDDVSTRIISQLPSFVRWLFQGRALIHGNQARIGSVQGEKGQSLAIDLKTGLWYDHATREKGDILQLYIMSQRVTFERALEELAREFLGDPVTLKRNPFEKSASQRISEAKARLGDRPHSLHLELGPPVASWKYYDLSGNRIASVERYEPEDGTKTYRPWCFKKGEDGKERWMKGAPDIRPLYNLATIAQSPSVVLVEGEKCADALIQLGIPATTAMQGAYAPVEKTDWSTLHGKHIIIWPDNDRPGIEYAEAVARHLGGLGCAVTVLDPSGHKDKWDAADCVSEGGDAQEFIRTAVRDPRDFRTYSLKELQNRPKPRLLVDKAIPENSFGMVWGPSQQFKTFVVLDLLLCLVHGLPWHGLEVKPGPVLYCAEEDSAGVTKRATGWHRVHELEEPDSTRLQFHVDGLALAEQVENLITAAKEMGAVLIVIETLARVFGNGNENWTQDMSAFVNACERVRRETGAVVLVVHHSGLDEQRERGNAALRAACDFIFKVKRLNGSLEVDFINEAPDGKQKNMAPLDTLKFTMKTVNFEYQGEEDSTLYPALADRAKETGETGEEIGGSSVYDKKPRKAKVGGVQRGILKVLEEAGIPLSRADLRVHFKDYDSGNFSNTIKGMLYRRLLEEVQIDGETMLRLNSR